MQQPRSILSFKEIAHVVVVDRKFLLGEWVESCQGICWPTVRLKIAWGLEPVGSLL